MTYIKTNLTYILFGILLASVLFTQYQIFTMKRADRAIVEQVAAQQNNTVFLVRSLLVANILVPTPDNKDFMINPMLIPPQ